MPAVVARTADRIHRPVITANQVRSVMGGFPGVVEYWFPDDLDLGNMAAVSSFAGGKGAHTISQGTGSAQPWKRLEGINGRAAVEYGGDDYLTRGATSLADNFSGDDKPCFCSAIVMPTTVATLITVIVAPVVRTNSIQGNVSILCLDDTGAYQTRRRGDTGSAVTAQFGLGWSKLAPRALVAHQKGTTADLWADRTRLVAGAALDTVSLSSASTDSAVGCFAANGTTGNFFTGLMGPLLLATTGMSNSDTAELMRVLMLYYRMGG